MRDTRIDSTKFCNLVERNITKMCNLDLNLLRNQVVDNSISRPGTMTFELKNLTMKDFVRLAIFSHYAPKEIGWVLRMDLEEYSSKFSLEDRTLCQQFLSSKTNMLMFLLETNLWHTRDFFGNILHKNFQLDRFLKIKKYNTKVIKPQRKRGYHDKGSRRESHKWLPSRDISLTELHYQIEAARESYIDTSQFIKGFLQ